MELKNRIPKINFQSVVILMILLIGFVSVLYQMIVKNLLVDVLNINNEFILGTLQTGDNPLAPETVITDWQTEYPADENSEYSQGNIVSTRKVKAGNINEGGKVSARIAKLYSMMDKYTSSYFTFTGQCEIVSKLFSKCMGMNLLMDTYGNLVYFQQDGRMMTERQYKNVDVEISNIVNFSEWLKDNGIDFLYVEVPSPVDPADEQTQIALGYEEYSNVMANQILDALDELGIANIDLRKLMADENRKYSEYFFPFDHHMLPSNGLWAAGKISNNIDQLLGTNANPAVFKEENYTLTTSSPVGKGSFYDVATDVYAHKYPMFLYSPNFETRFTKWISKYRLELEGNFDEVMYAMYDYPTYNVWNHGIQSIKKYKNMINSVADTSEKPILLLTESYSDVIVPFLACAYSDIEEIDLRLFDGSIETYINKSKPAVVVVIYSAYDINASGAESLFEFD